MLVENMYINENNEIIDGNFFIKDLVFARPNEHNIDLKLINFFEDPQYLLSFFKKLKYLEFSDYYYKNTLDNTEVYYENFIISDFALPISVTIASSFLCLLIIPKTFLYELSGVQIIIKSALESNLKSFES